MRCQLDFPWLFSHWTATSSVPLALGQSILGRGSTNTILYLADLWWRAWSATAALIAVTSWNTQPCVDYTSLFFELQESVLFRMFCRLKPSTDDSLSSLINWQATIPCWLSAIEYGSYSFYWGGNPTNADTSALRHRRTGGSHFGPCQLSVFQKLGIRI